MEPAVELDQHPQMREHEIEPETVHVPTVVIGPLLDEVDPGLAQRGPHGLLALTGLAPGAPAPTQVIIRDLPERAMLGADDLDLGVVGDVLGARVVVHPARVGLLGLGHELDGGLANTSASHIRALTGRDPLAAFTLPAPLQEPF